jgi:anti-sigma factor RsiW
MSLHPISETDLQAYVDSALPEARRTEIEDYLGGQPEEAGRVQAYRAQKQAIRALFNPVLDEPLPENLRALIFPPRAAVTEYPKRTMLSHWSLQRIAASLLIALASSYAGWLAHGRYPPAENMALLRPLPQQAAVAHVVFSPDARRPVEVLAEHEDQLVAWLSKRLGTPMHPPKLAALGYELVGGRLLPGNSGPVAQFMYQDSTGRRLTLYISTEYTTTKETAFRFAQEGSVNVFYWVDGQCGYALSGSIEKGELARVSSAVYAQIENK